MKLTKYLRLAIAPLAAIGAIALAGSMIAGNTLFAPGSTPPPAFRPPSTATAVPSAALVSHPNPALGYTIGAPATYRVAGSRVGAGASGQDIFTPRTRDQDVALCRQEQQGGMPAAERVADFSVTVSANPSGMSPAAYADAPNRRLEFVSLEQTSINGLAAVRVVHQPSGDTASYVIASDGRLYHIAPLVYEQPTTQPKGWLDAIATSFRALPVVNGPAVNRSACE